MATTTSRITVSTNTYTSSVFQEAVKFNFLHVIYAADATVGNRQLNAVMYDSSGNILWDSHSGAVSTASTVHHYEWLPGTYRETAFIDNSLQVPFPADMELPGNAYFKVYDTANISASDTMIISMQYRNADRY